MPFGNARQMDGCTLVNKAAVGSFGARLRCLKHFTFTVLASQNQTAAALSVVKLELMAARVS
jgi:hypothetical protein